jgi:hypothetical protein
MSTNILIDKTNECVICFDLINEESKLIIFENCKHNNNYHNDCINNWIIECTDKNIYPTCPICNNKLKLVDVDNYELDQTCISTLIPTLYYICFLGGIYIFITSIIYFNIMV